MLLNLLAFMKVLVNNAELNQAASISVFPLFEFKTCLKSEYIKS